MTAFGIGITNNRSHQEERSKGTSKGLSTVNGLFVRAISCYTTVFDRLQLMIELQLLISALCITISIAIRGLIIENSV